MVGIYFSGTGNTKHCVEAFVKAYNESATVVPIESPDVFEAILSHNMLVFGYPIYFSNAPKIIKDFIVKHGRYFKGKKIFIIATMGLFSGDGTGCTARLFKKCQANIIGGLHLKMPDCIGDEKALKKPLEANRALVCVADSKIASAVERLKKGNPTREGLNFLYHMAGLFGQRLWFYRKSTSYKKKPNVDKQKCIGCGSCAKLCPMKNISIEDGKASSHSKCTMCYRCFSHCPTQALTILGKRVYEQCLFESYR